MNGLFPKSFSPAARLLILTGSGFVVGLLMPQLYITAHNLDLFVGLMDFIHAPAVLLAEITHRVFHVADDFIRSLLGVPRPKVFVPPGGLAVDFGPLKCLSSAIVIEWTVVGAVTGIVWNCWESRWGANRKLLPQRTTGKGTAQR